MNTRLTPRLVVVLSCLFVSMGLGEAWGQQSHPPAELPSLPVLTRVSDIHELSEKEAERGYPVRIRGVVTFYGGPPLLFVQDFTGGIYVQTLIEQHDVTAGDLIEVKGVTGHGLFANQVERPEVHVLGRAPLPDPHRPRLEELALGREDSQWVEITGIVHSTQIEEPSKKLILSLTVGSGRVKVAVRNYPKSALSSLLDTRIRIQGACGGIFNPRHQMIGAIIYVQDVNSVQILEPSPLTAESPPVESIRDLARLSARTTSGHRVKVRGIVTLQRPSHILYIQDATESLKVDTSQPTTVQPGDAVEVWGFPVLGAGSRELEDAEYRQLASGPPPVPADITVTEALEGNYDNSLVRLQGRMFELITEGPVPELVVESGRVAFQARVFGEGAQAALARLEVGSRVRITGVCDMLAEENGAPPVFRLLVRSPNDVEVLEKASWWNPPRVLGMLGLMGALMLAAAAWVILLRKQVGAKTREIREWLRREAALKDRYRDLLENAIDMVYTRDLQGNFTSVNNTLVRVLGYTRVELLGMNIAQILAPEYFDVMRQALDKTKGGEASGDFELEFITKRGARLAVEVRGRLLYEDGKAAGVQGIARNVTERKQVEQQVRLQAAALEAAALGIVITDREGNITWVNPAFTALSGYTLEEVIGKNSRLLRSGKHDAEFYRDMWNTILSGRVWRGEIVNRHKDGTFYNEELTITPVCRMSGEITHFVAIGQDISARKQAEETRARLAAIVESSNDAIIGESLDGTIVSWNTGAELLYGYRADEVIGKPVSLLAAPDRPDEEPRILEQVRQGERITHFETVGVHKGGRRIDVSLTLSPIKNPRGEVVGSAVIAHDITQRLQAEEALRQSEEKYRSIVLNIPDVVWTLNSCGRFVFVSPNIERVTGYTPEEFEQGGWEFFFGTVHPDDVQAIKETLQAAFRDHQPREAEYRGRHKDGKPSWARARTMGAFEKDGVQYLQGLLSDITERKRAEEELRLTQFSLEHASDAIFWMDPQGRIVYVNEAACRALGRSREELLSLSIPDIDPLFPKEAWEAHWEKVKTRGSMTFETQHQTKQGRVFPVEITANYLEFNGKEYSFAFARDITERKRAERSQCLSAEILRTLNEPLGVGDVVKQILAAIRRETGVDAVGIRLRSGDDFPYYVQSGFSPEFLLTENTLLARDRNGSPCRDKNGNLSLECTCGLVLSGQTDPANPLFTKDGSCWTNNSLVLLDLPAHQDHRLHPRNKCVHQGYCSVALIPIRAHGDIMGLLQLNDRKKDCFTLEMIQFLEGISASIGVALMRKQQEEDLRASEELLRTMTDQVPGIVYQFYARPNGERGVNYVSARAERLFGLSPELSGFVARFVAAIAPESRDALIQSIDKAVADFSEWNYEGLLQKPGGESMWISVHSTPTRRQDEIVFDGIIQDITERKRAENENARLAAIVNSSEDAILSTTREGFINTWNAGAERIYGYTGEEIKGKHFSIFIPEDCRGEVASKQERLFRGEALVHNELENMRMDGSKLQVSLTISPIKDATGIVTGVSVIARDITERRRAEEELYQSRQMLQSILDTIPQRVFWKDRNIAYLGCNRAFAIDAGLKNPAEIIGKNDFELAWRESAELYRADDKLVMEQETPRLNYEEIQNRPDGSQIWVRSSKLPLHNRDGKVIGVLGTYEDISERRRAADALRESESRLRTITDSAHDAILMMDPQGRISYWNPAAERILGYTSAEAIGQNLHSLIVPPRYHEAHQAAFPAFRQTGQGPAMGKTRDLEVRRKDGKEMSVRLSLSAIQINGGWYAVGIVGDISERKQVEVATHRAMEAAEEANRAKGEFLANMSHELRTPMNAVIGMTELALATNLDPEQRHYLELVESSADSLLDLINNILDFSKIDAGKLELEATPFILANVVDTALRSLAIPAYRKGLEMACGLDHGIPSTLVGDPLRLTQIVVKLVENAIKFTDQGEVVLRAWVESKEEAAVMLHIAVADTGVGIPADKIAMVFEAFTQVDGSLTRRFEGAGLGLAICSELVRMMGGAIWVESGKDRGSTFHVTVRLGLATRTVSTSDEGASDLLRGVPVLVVDNHAASREILADMLRHRGMVPTVVEGGEAALATIREAQASVSPFRLALFDAQISGSDGLVLAEQARRITGFCAPILMLLPPTDAGREATRCRELGIVDYCPKPVGESDLVKAMVKALEMSAGGTAHPKICGSSQELGRALHILLAESNEVSQVLVTHLLEKRGHQVSAAADGLEVLAAVQDAHSQDFDLVLMDTEMPGMNGLEATRAIREFERKTGGRLPIIAMTAHPQPSEEEACRAAGMDAYLAKPLRASALFEIIQRAATPPEAAAPVKPTPPPVFDKSCFLSRLEGDELLGREIIEMFLRECPKLLQNVHEAAEQRNPSLLERAAHSLKGSVGDMAAPQAFAAARTLEQNAREGKLEDADAALMVLEPALNRLVDELRNQGG